MNKIIKSIVSMIAGKFHIIIVSKAPVVQVEKFLEKIHPKKSGHEFIRIGPDHDGGYLIPDCLDGISNCFSPGVDTESGFELDLANRGINVFMADYSVDQPKVKHRRFSFEKKYLSFMDYGIYMTMDSWVKNSIGIASNSDLLLQMDIEGSEYECLLAVSNDLLNKFRIIVIEFHHFNRIFERDFLRMVEKVFNKLLINHSVVHIHPNNKSNLTFTKGVRIPSLLEITFLRNDFCEFTGYVDEFPHLLDKNNIAGATIILPKCFFKSG
ncbi:FkbM family methyltransferase [Algoriphagus sp. C2-6-M1]|uniref:FkbM family methyltransferase n=1 Tax=Algoriphagus persicinus TaxID=3108754 RepID=UPI002B3C68BF|nr:FkbM family methyltransferase [Algoriphagus sp. C2-6-M1]MEB2782420.1 FkbM family methyltransferase [Algoriphagus sp. C2-6-M1]